MKSVKTKTQILFIGSLASFSVAVASCGAPPSSSLSTVSPGPAPTSTVTAALPATTRSSVAEDGQSVKATVGNAEVREFRDGLLSLLDRLQIDFVPVTPEGARDDIEYLRSITTEVIVGEIGGAAWVEETTTPKLGEVQGQAVEFWLYLPVVGADGTRRNVVFFVASEPSNSDRLGEVRKEVGAVGAILRSSTPVVAFVAPKVDGDHVDFASDAVGAPLEGFVLADEAGRAVSLAPADGAASTAAPTMFAAFAAAAIAAA
jgi:hypothetical protein